ncbi:MAG: WYL domain-containing protein, partial [Gemmatimonadota bacterium]|nr:WYL domain-containing protein [Gemmatimonadota bacterium]
FDLDLDRFSPSPLLWAERPGTAEVLERLRILSGALLDHKRVRFGYEGIGRGASTERDVAPYGLFLQRDWYLVGHDETRGTIRVFRVARMRRPEPNRKAPKTPDYAVPDGFALADYLQREAWELGSEEDDTLAAEVRFHFPASLWAAQNEHGELIEESADGSSIRRFQVQQTDPFLRWTLSLAGEVEIIAPPELRAALYTLSDEVEALYRDEVPADA